MDLLMAAALAGPAAYRPPDPLWYEQAVACAASALVEKGRQEPTGDQFGEMMTWGMIMAETGRRLGRTKEQVDSGDLRAAEPFYRHLKQKKKPAFAAHRAYCRALLDADRP
jgi:hypothetical protein